MLRLHIAVTERERERERERARMSDQDQEPEMWNLFFQETEEGDGFEYPGSVNRLAMLLKNLSPTFSDCDHRIADDDSPFSVHHCAACGCSLKKRSPSSSSLQEPRSKKMTLYPSSSSAAAVDGGELTLQGFTLVPLPNDSPVVRGPPTSDPTPSAPALRRCVSDPLSSPGTNNGRIPGGQFPGSLTVSSCFLNPMSPESAKITALASSPSPAKAGSSSGSAALPPLPPILGRSISDSIAAPFQTKTTPQDQIKGESPKSKRLMKRMKDRMKEMSQWWDEVSREGDNNSAPTPKDESETECEEAVSVESSGNSLMVRINCPCGKGSQVIFSGKNCYYKLL